MKLKLLITLSILCCYPTCSDAEKRKVLMIGNSYIYTNDLPAMLKDLALSLGDTLEISSSAPGGYSFNQHTTNTTTLALIAQGGWDYVVLQAQSQEPSFPPAQVATNTYPYAKKLDSLVHISNPCAETIFYMTWGKKNGDPGNCVGYPILCTYAGVYSRLRESYLQMTQDNQATCAPVGVAWDRIITNNPSVELFVSDGSHPNPNGTYLTACTFYTTLFHKSCIGAQYSPSTVTNSDAFLFQTTATQTVLDSLENWQQYGKLSFAKFSNTNNQNQYSFTNQSLRSTLYEWNFGDGSAISNQSNPIHTYANNGTYTISLKSKNSCGKYDINQKTIQIPTVPNSTQSIDPTESTSIYFQHGNLQLKHVKSKSSLEIYNTKGQSIYKHQITEIDTSINLNNFTSGIYFYTLTKPNTKTIQGKFIVNY